MANIAYAPRRHAGPWIRVAAARFGIRLGWLVKRADDHFDHVLDPSKIPQVVDDWPRIQFRPAHLHRIVEAVLGEHDARQAAKIEARRNPKGLIVKRPLCLGRRGFCWEARR